MAKFVKGGPNPGRKFQKGRSGNPRGRPPDIWSPRSCLRIEARQVAMVEMTDPMTGKTRLVKHPEGLTVAQVVARKAIFNAYKGDQRAIEFVTMQIDGEVPRTIIPFPVSSEGEGEVPAAAPALFIVGGSEDEYIRSLRAMREKKKEAQQKKRAKKKTG